MKGLLWDLDKSKMTYRQWLREEDEYINQSQENNIIQNNHMKYIGIFWCIVQYKTSFSLSYHFLFLTILLHLYGCVMLFSFILF